MQLVYRIRAIISWGLYIFYPIFENHLLVFKQVIQKILSLCTASIQEQVIMAHIQNFLPHFSLRFIIEQLVLDNSWLEFKIWGW